jgi:YesN/AraC family two-component response regulator
MIRVLIADDHGIVRSGLRMLIDRQNDMQVVAEADDGVAALEAPTSRCSTCRCRG